ncbi:MAG: phage major capsid protein [Chloroflexi bacterium]|nr:MAG: phage major capsid protein [Chloroflexota bacterium]
MALTLDELNAITLDYWERGTTDIYFLDNVLLWKLLGNGNLKNELVKASETVDGGLKIRVILEYAESNSGTYGNVTKIAQAKVDILNAARFRWAGYFASNTIDLNDKIQNAGRAAMVKLANAKIKNIQKTIRKKMGTDIYASAADSYAFLGLGNLFNTAGGTAYGEIAQDDMGDWKANVITTAEPISFKTLQKCRRTPNIGQNDTDKPNLYITTDLLKDGFERTLQVQARYKDVDLADAGFENVLFKGQPVVADDRQTATYCDCLNLRYMRLRAHSAYNFTPPVWEANLDQPDVWTANQRMLGQLTTNHRKSHIRHTNLTEPA